MDNSSLIPYLFERFNGAEIRIIEQDEDVWIPIKDIGETLKYDHKEIINMINRNAVFFDGFTRGINLMTREKMSEFEIKQNTLKCVNEQGFYMLISKISLNHITDEEVKKNIIEFNRWMVNIIKKVRENKNKPQYGDYLKQEMIIVEELNRVLNLDKTLLTNVALENTERLTNVSMLPYKQMLPAVEGVIAVLRATDIGKELGITPSQVNLILSDLGYIIKENKQWTITELGKQYGMAYFESKAYETGALWTGVINKWSPEVIHQIKDYLNTNN